MQDNYGGIIYELLDWKKLIVSVCRSGIRGPLAYSLLGGGIPTQSIG